MFVIFGRRARVKRKRGGRRETRLCPECDATTTFHEADEKEAFHVFFIEVYSGDDTVWICGACEENMPWEATLPPSTATATPALSPRAQAKLDAKQRKARVRAQRKAQKEAAKRDREVDDELARLKARLRDE